MQLRQVFSHILDASFFGHIQHYNFTALSANVSAIFRIVLCDPFETNTHDKDSAAALWNTVFQCVKNPQIHGV